MNWVSYSLAFIAVLFTGLTNAQDAADKVLLTGVVLSGDPLVPVPNTNIIVQNKNKGTASNENGFFSFYAEVNDTLKFSAVGFKDGQYVVPDELNQDHYSIVQIMTNDTIWLQETIIFPWKDYETFGEELVKMNPPPSDEQLAQMNLDDAQLYEKSVSLYMDGSANFKYQTKLYADRMYFAGQVPPMQIFNPFAWADFIKSIKNGAYKKK